MEDGLNFYGSLRKALANIGSSSIVITLLVQFLFPFDQTTKVDKPLMPCMFSYQVLFIVLPGRIVFQWG